MTEHAIIRRNSLFSFLSTATRLIANMLMFVGVARLYGADVFGQFTTAHTYLTLFLYLSDFGFDLLVAADTARDRAASTKFFLTVIPVRTVFAVLATVAMLGTTIALPLKTETKLFMALLSLTIPASAFCTFLYAFFKGHDQIQYEARNSFVQNAALLVALVVMGIMHAPALAVAGVFVGSRLLGAVLMVAMALRTFGRRMFAWSFEGFGRVLLRGAPYGFNLLFGALFLQADTLMLVSWRGESVAGTYQAAMKLVILVLTVPDVVAGAFLPVLARLHATDRIKWIRVSRLLAKSMLFAGFSVSLLFFMAAPEIIHLVYGARGFQEAIPVMQILAFTVAIRFFIEPYGLVLTSANAQHKRMWIIIVATVCNVAGNVYAIPHFGVQGAAIASVLSNLILAAGFITLAGTESSPSGSLPSANAVALVLAIACVAIAVSLLGPPSWLSGALLALGVCPVLFYFMGYTPDERRLILTASGYRGG